MNELSGEADFEAIKRCYTLLISSIEIIKRFAKKIPGFLELDKSDQELLFYSSCLELFVLRFAYR